MSLRPIKSRKARHHAQARLKGRSDIAWGWGRKRIDWSHFFTTRKFKALAILILALSILGALYPTPLFHNYETVQCIPTQSEIEHGQPCGDPDTVLWLENFASGDISGWNNNRASYVTNIKGSGLNGILLSSDNNGPAIALTQSSFDASAASAKELQFLTAFNNVTKVTTNTEFGWYLTRNGTLPGLGPDASYNPANDPQVSLYFRMNWQNQAILTNLIIQRDPNIPLSNAQYPNCTDGSGQGVCQGVFTTNQNINFANNANLILNYTGNQAAGGHNGANSIGPVGASGVSIDVFNLPWLQIQGVNYYLGFFVAKGNGGSGIAWYQNDGGSTHLLVQITQPIVVNPPPAQPPAIDTGGFFGPIIRALISIGIFILNGILQFISFVAPTIISAISFLETVWVLVLNAIGTLVGFGNVGSDIQTLIGNVINFFTQQVPTIFTNTGALFARFFDINSVYFSWLPTALNIALTIVTLAVNSIIFVLTIIDFSFRLVGGVYLIILLTLFLVYTGDDALGGILGFIETTQWLILGPLGWLCKILNFALDIVTYLVGLIPKPFIQMVAHSIPRIPIIETSARFVNPSFDLAAIRNGNMLAVWAWFVDFTFLAWYNGVTPALPGSLGYLLPGMPATTFAALRGFLPMLEICLIVVSALAFIIWPVNKMFSMISLDLDILDFDMSPGRKISQTGLGAVRVKIGKKRLQGRLSKKLEKRKQEKIEKETRRVLGEGGVEKVREEGKRLKEEFERTKRQAELQKERNQ